MTRNKNKARFNFLSLSVLKYLTTVTVTSVSAGSVHSVSMIIVHYAYNRTITDNDVAVLVLASALRFSANIQSAIIPFQGETLTDNSTVIAVGWGRTIVSMFLFCLYL